MRVRFVGSRSIQDLPNGTQSPVLPAQQTDDSGNIWGDLFHIIVQASWDWLSEWVDDQLKHEKIPVAEVQLQPTAVHGVFNLVGATTYHALTVTMDTEWDDELQIYADADTPYTLRPGADVHGYVFNQQIKGPGRMSAVVTNTAGKPIEVIGNWSINLAFSLSIDGQAVPGGGAHISGWEGRGKQWTYGPWTYPPEYHGS